MSNYHTQSPHEHMGFVGFLSRAVFVLPHMVHALYTASRAMVLQSNTISTTSLQSNSGPKISFLASALPDPLLLSFVTNHAGGGGGGGGGSPYNRHQTIQEKSLSLILTDLSIGRPKRPIPVKCIWICSIALWGLSAKLVEGCGKMK